MDERKQINFTIVPEESGDSPRTYANFCAISHTPFDFTLTVAKPAGWPWSTPKEIFENGTLWSGVRIGNLPVGLGFSGMFLIGAIAVSSVLLGRLVESERQRIGTLRALGITRGELVRMALAASSVGAARSTLRALDPDRYNPFHLVVVGGDGGFLWRYDGRSADMDAIGPGLHVVSERDPHGRSPRAEWVRARWPTDLAPPGLRRMLAGHGEPPGDFPCVHLGEVYGTRSAAIVRLGASLAVSELHVADGPPCTAPLENRSSLLTARHPSCHRVSAADRQPTRCVA